MSQLLTIEDLAEKWKCSVGSARTTVQVNQIPYVRLGAGDMKPPWNLRRFRIEDIEVWEKERRKAEPSIPEDAPKKPAHSAYLGNWRGD